jgi:hypothetical protein
MCDERTSAGSCRLIVARASAVCSELLSPVCFGRAQLLAPRSPSLKLAAQCMSASPSANVCCRERESSRWGQLATFSNASRVFVLSANQALPGQERAVICLKSAATRYQWLPAGGSGGRCDSWQTAAVGTTGRPSVARAQYRSRAVRSARQHNARLRVPSRSRRARTSGNENRPRPARSRLRR